jgi:GT2 family glycosyltransferase
MSKNTGGAGGFHEGLSRAYRAGYDWFWLMDDDVEPYQDGLAKLLSYQKDSGCIQGRRMNPDGTPMPWGEHFDPYSVTTTPIVDGLLQSGQDKQAVTVGCFEGMLVNRGVVRQIGLPDSAFFIGWDDTYYGYLASRVTHVLYVNVIALRRKRQLASVAPSLFNRRNLYKQSPLFLYYNQRNRFLIAHSLANRSFAFALASIRTLLRSMLREIVIFKSPSGAMAVLRGFWHGILYYMSRGSVSKNF